jgi:SAM-dependent methyltransferase
MPNSKQHYTASYFAARYAHIIGDEANYDALGRFWRAVIFEKLDIGKGTAKPRKILDYGCGTGVITAGCGDADCFDVSNYATDFLKSRGRMVFTDAAQIPKAAYDVVLCCHSLEHYPEPLKALLEFKGYLAPGGVLVLVLPIETDFSVRLQPDVNQHFYCWTFQTISNLLRHAGWDPFFAEKIHGPFLLRTSAKLLPIKIAVAIARLAGRIKNEFPSILVAARLGPIA